MINRITIKIFSLLVNFLHQYVINFSVGFHCYFLASALCKLYSGFYYPKIIVFSSLLGLFMLYIFIKLVAYFFYYLYYFDSVSVKLQDWSGLSKESYRFKEHSLRGLFKTRHIWGGSLSIYFMIFLCSNIISRSRVFIIIAMMLFIEGSTLAILFQNWTLLKLWFCVVFGLKGVAMFIQLGYSSKYYSKLLYKKTRFTGRKFSSILPLYEKDGVFYEYAFPGASLVLYFKEFSFKMFGYFFLHLFGPLMHILFCYMLCIFGYSSNSLLQILFSFL